MALDVSAFVLTQNNQSTIRACLDSVAWCDEIVVIDSFSTDATPQIAQSYPNLRFFQHKYVTAREQRVWGIEHVHSKWTFILDSDEICTPDLQDELIRILKSGDNTHDGYLCLIRTRILGTLLKHQDCISSFGKRLVLTKRATRYHRASRVHASIKLDNKRKLPPSLYIIHDPIRSFSEHFQKMARYARWQADDMFEQGKQVRWWHITLRPVGKFLQFYVLKGGYRDGLEGAIACALGALNVAMKHIILAELIHADRQQSK